MDVAIGYIAAHPEIWEVILTGGDPLVLSARRLEEMMLRLRDIAHVKIVRFHSRVPVVEPERVDDKLIAALKASGKTTYVALHANHPRELDAGGAGGGGAAGRCRRGDAQPVGAAEAASTTIRTCWPS
jgi:lysine 2,3-aminomutase